MEMPLIGLGTWELRGVTCTNVVKKAFEVGYRCIDTAHYYENHEAIREAIKDFDRSKLYIVSKLAIEQQIDISNPEYSVEIACNLALKELGTDYLDLYLIHWPNRNYPLGKIFASMNKLVEQGKILKAGVSNYNTHHLEDLRNEGLHPFANQVEFHPYLYQKQLLEYCQKHEIQLISFRSFGKGRLLVDEPLFGVIGAKHNKTGAQVILRWLIQKGIPAVPKASSEKHLLENFEIFDFSLTRDEMEQLDSLDQKKRYCTPEDPEYNY